MPLAAAPMFEQHGRSEGERKLITGLIVYFLPAEGRKHWRDSKTTPPRRRWEKTADIPNVSAFMGVVKAPSTTFLLEASLELLSRFEQSQPPPHFVSDLSGGPPQAIIKFR